MENLGYLKCCETKHVDKNYTMFHLKEKFSVTNLSSKTKFIINFNLSAVNFVTIHSKKINTKDIFQLKFKTNLRDKRICLSQYY